jgi:hypothetical protein
MSTIAQTLELEEPALRVLQKIEWWVWAAAVALWGMADWVTTAVSMLYRFGGESNPIPAAVIEAYGHAGHLGFKLLVFAGLYLVWRTLPRPYRVAVPLGVAAAGTKLTVGNIQVIAQGL